MMPSQPLLVVHLVVYVVKDVEVVMRWVNEWGVFFCSVLTKYIDDEAIRHLMVLGGCVMWLKRDSGVSARENLGHRCRVQPL